MKKNRAFTLLELILSLALFAMVSIMLLSLLNFATSSTTETERAAEAVSNSSATKELLVRTISPSTSIEILKPITAGMDLTDYIDTLNASGEDDEEYTYLYSIDGVVYYRNPGTATIGEEIRTISTTDVDLSFIRTPDANNRMLNINMTFTTKEIEPYVLEDMLSITPLNFATGQEIIDDRSDKVTPSNIIRFVSEEIIMDDITPVRDDTPKIISATVFNIPVDNSPKGVYDIPFYVSQQPKVVQLYNYASYADRGDLIVSQNKIDNELHEYEKVDAYFNNTVIGQSTFVSNNNPTTHDVSFVYRGHTFIDIYGNEYVGTENPDGTRTINIKIPTYVTVDNMKFSVRTENGVYVTYDYRVTTEPPKPEIVKFEFLPEDNAGITHKLKTYINQSDVYYSNENRLNWAPINGTEGASRPAPYNVLDFGSTKIDEPESYYSTIVMPTNPQALAGDFYPKLGDQVASDNLSTRVATITFKGTSLHDPDGQRIAIPETEWGKLNGVSEVTTKVSIDKNFTGDITTLNGEKYSDVYKDSGLTTDNGVKFEDYTFKAYKAGSQLPVVTNNEWFDPQNDVDSYNLKGKGYIFSVVNGPIVKRYTYQNEASTTKANYHEGTSVDSGLSRVWVDGYMDGAWVGGSMRGDVSGDIVVTVPYDKFDSIKDNVTLKASVYGKELVQLPSYPYGTYSRPGATTTTDNYSYYGLTDRTYTDTTASWPNPVYTVKTEATLESGSSPDSSIRYNANYIKHFVLIQNDREYGPMVRYQVKIAKSYPQGVIEPEVESIRIYEETNDNVDKTFLKNDGSFTPNSIMETKYSNGQNIKLKVAFAGAKIRIGTSIDPTGATEYKNNIANKDSYYELEIPNMQYGTDYFIHLYDYQGDWKEAYRITTKNPKVRSNVVYDLDTEMKTGIRTPSETTQPFLPTKTDVPGSSYGYQVNNNSDVLFETPIYLNDSSIMVNYLNKDPNNNVTNLSYIRSLNMPVPLVTRSNPYSDANLFGFVPKNLSQYNLTGQNKTINGDWRMYIRSTRTDYTKGGNNLNTASQYNITNFMTPILINKEHLLVQYYARPDYLYQQMTTWKVNTDAWIYDTWSRLKKFTPPNVKLDTTGFSVKIFNDRVYSQKIGGTLYSRSTGRPGTVVETNYDIAIVDTTTDSFNVESFATDTTNNTNTDFKYSLPHDNSAKPKTIKTNDVVGYGFSLIEQDVDRDPSQNYLGTGTKTGGIDDREVALMFYVRHFVAGEGTSTNLGIDLGKVPGTYVKLADLTGFNMTSTNAGNSNEKNPNNAVNNKADIGDELYSQAVNFTVDVQTTFDGDTRISTKEDYEKVMKNNYIGFTVTELDIQGNPTGKVHFKLYSFADVFGGVRVDDNYNELNLILNHYARTLDNGTSNRKVRLSVGYGTNWGLVGISDFKIMR